MEPLHVILQGLEPGWHVGRISEGQFEYDQINDWMSPREAEILCEEDLKCGGFTYRGTRMLDRHYNIYFFHFLVNIESDSHSLKWTFYKSHKTFLTFPGVFSDKGQARENMRRMKHTDSQGAPAGWVTSRARAEERCMELGSDCLALESRTDSNVVTLLDYIDLDTFRPSQTVSTRVRADNTDRKSRILGRSSWDLSDIDYCCPENKKIDRERLMLGVKENIERVSCLIPAQEFQARYVRRQIPVILENCTSQWRAQQTWSFQSILSLGGGRETWRTDYITNHQILQLWGQKEFLTGETVAHIMKNNGTVRIFEVLGRKRAQERLRRGEKEGRLKEEMMEDYERPAPIPQDLFNISGIQTDYQWAILSQADTGTGLHMDPEYTMAWNSVLTGVKLWALLPLEVGPALEPAFSCSAECSQTREGDISIQSWFSHLLPQLEDRKWYGRSTVIFTQRPGDTLYLPPRMGHAILNLEENISVTENYFLVDSLEDMIHGLMMGESVMFGDKHEGRLWLSLYNKLLNREDREVARNIIDQVQVGLYRNPDLCYSL